MFSPYIWNTINFYVWKIKINDVHANMLLDDQQLCIRSFWSLGDLYKYSIDYAFNKIQIKKITSEVPFNLSSSYVLNLKTTSQRENMVANLPNLDSAICRYIKSQNGNVSDEVIDILYDIDYRRRTRDTTRVFTRCDKCSFFLV